MKNVYDISKRTGIDWYAAHSPGKEDNILEFQLLERCVYEAAKRNTDKPVLEIGSFHGLTALLAAQYVPVICLDIWCEDDLQEDAQKKITLPGQSESWKGFQQNRIDNGCFDRIFPVCATSAYLDILPPLNLELCFIDGCHTDPWPLLDAERCDRHLTDTGIMVFHDALRGYVKEFERSVKSVDECIGHGWGHPPMDRMTFDPWEDVGKAVRQLVKEGGWEPYDKAHGMLALKRKK
jgi:hypothetical protein